MDVAALQGKTIKEYAIEKLFPPVPDEEQAWADLKTLVEQRIAESSAGAVSSKTFDGIVDEELRTGGMTPGDKQSGAPMNAETT
jgi:hypothetical protein